MNSHFLPKFLVVALISEVLAHGAETTTVDICIYGGTSGAIAAAVQAERMNKTASWFLRPGTSDL